MHYQRRCQGDKMYLGIDFETTINIIQINANAYSVFASDLPHLSPRCGEGGRI